MNDQLQQALAVVLQGATDAVSSGVSFLKAELPDVIHQLLAWKLAANFATAILCLCIAAAGAWFMWKASTAKAVGAFRDKPHSYERDYEGATVGDWSVLAGLGCIPAIIAVLLGGGMAFSSALTCIQIWIAPKIYLIEYAARLAGGK